MCRTRGRKANAPAPPPSANDFVHPRAGRLKKAGQRTYSFARLDEPMEMSMAKGQMRSNKEKKKPKAEAKPKAMSAYKQQFGKQSSQPVTAPKKD